MNKLFPFVFVILSMIFLSGCEKEPIASFTVSKSSIELGESVTFTNTSADADHYEWEFGDNGTSKEENPSHTYTYTGTFEVSLMAYSEKEKRADVAFQTITVSVTKPTASFTVETKVMLARA